MKLIITALIFSQFISPVYSFVEDYKFEHISSDCRVAIDDKDLLKLKPVIESKGYIVDNTSPKKMIRYKDGYGKRHLKIIGLETELEDLKGKDTSFHFFQISSLKRIINNLPECRVAKSEDFHGDCPNFSGLYELKSLSHERLRHDKHAKIKIEQRSCREINYYYESTGQWSFNYNNSLTLANKVEPNQSVFFHTNRVEKIDRKLVLSVRDVRFDKDSITRFHAINSDFLSSGILNSGKYNTFKTESLKYLDNGDLLNEIIIYKKGKETFRYNYIFKRVN